MRRLAVLLFVSVLGLGAGCGGDDDDVSASGGGFCDRARDLDAQMNALDEQFSGDTMPTPEVFEQTADAIGDLADGAPDEIEGDLEILADGVREIAEVFGEIDFTDTEFMQDPANADQVQQLIARMEELDETVGESGERVEDYLGEECGIDVDDVDDGGSDGEEGTEGS